MLRRSGGARYLGCAARLLDGPGPPWVPGTPAASPSSTSH